MRPYHVTLQYSRLAKKDIRPLQAYEHQRLGYQFTSWIHTVICEGVVAVSVMFNMAVRYGQVNHRPPTKTARAEMVESSQGEHDTAYF